jgi:transcription initiation factor TFIIB
MVVSDRIQETREASHRLFTAEAKERERTGMPPSLAHSYMGLSTVIGKTDKDASGYKIEPRCFPQYVD